MFSRHNGADEIRQWLEEQKRIIGRDSNRTIDKILSSMMLDRMYRENYEKETFLIVPLERNADLSQNIRRDLNNPLRFLLLVEDTSGRIRKGAVALFYPLENNVSVLPENSFHNYFINQMIRLEGTFSMISLMDIKQYEMDFDNNGNRKEYRLWYGKQTILEPLPQLPVCIDWYLTTTIFSLMAPPTITKSIYTPNVTKIPKVEEVAVSIALPQTSQVKLLQNKFKMWLFKQYIMKLYLSIRCKE